jgi:hypothetical protein
MDLMPLNLKRETDCAAGVGGTVGAASTSWSGRGERKMELRNMVKGVCGVVRSSGLVFLISMAKRRVGLTRRCCYFGKSNPIAEERKRQLATQRRVVCEGQG